MMAGSKKDAVTAFFEDMKRCGLNDPLLVIVFRALSRRSKFAFRARSARLHYLFTTMGNIAGSE
jgi:hypothetical protein